MSRRATLLRRVLRRLSDPKHWIQGAMARNANGLFADPCSEDATTWCYVGAVFAEWPDLWERRGLMALSRYAAQREQGLAVRQIAFEAGFIHAPTHPDQGDEVRWNNGIEHPELIAGLREAIRRYEAVAQSDG